MEQKKPHPTPALACSCCTPQPHDHDNEHPDAGEHHGHTHSALPSWGRIGTALLLALLAEAAHWWQAQHPALSYVGMALAVLAIGLTGLGIYRQGLADVRQLRLGIHALMAVAVTGAFLIGQWPEAAMVMALYTAAERLEDQAADRARQAIGQLLALTPDTALVQQADGSYHTQPTSAVALHATVRVPPGAHIPLDGDITQGHSSVDQSPITGESVPVDKAPGDSVWAGSVNQQGELHILVTRTSSESLLARMARAVEQAQRNKAPVQRLVDRFAAVYTPTVMLLALALAALAPWLLGWPVLDAIYQALALLVIACPCALVLSTPVTVVSALTAAARQGVLLKGGAVLEAARHLRHVALDKTGTLTTGRPALVDWQALDGEQPLALAQLAAQLAARSDHPVSQAIAQGLADSPPPNGNAVQIAEVHALPGRGVQAQTTAQQTLYLVNLRWAQENQLVTAAVEAAVQTQADQGRSVSLLADGRQVLAWFAVADTLRPQATVAVQRLQDLGVQVHMLSGDHPSAAQAIARQAGIAQAQGGLLPEDKLRHLQQLQGNGPTAMVGDGINDAPALAQADLGFAMGGAHSTGMAMETADVVLVHDDLRRIGDTIQLARATYAVLWQNIALALGIKLVFLALALSGHASMWLAVLADMGVSLLVVANGLRLRRWRGTPAQGSV